MPWFSQRPCSATVRILRRERSDSHRVKLPACLPAKGGRADPEDCETSMRQINSTNVARPCSPRDRRGHMRTSR